MACQADLVSQRSIGNENCLHLSVYTRDIKPDTLKPVMVWIHGGAYILGSNSKDFYNPEFLLRKDVVLIAINYRLGAFGKCHFQHRNNWMIDYYYHCVFFSFFLSFNEYVRRLNINRKQTIMCSLHFKTFISVEVNALITVC